MAFSNEKIRSIKTDFEAGKISIKEIAEKYCVHRTTINSLAKQYHWSRENRPLKKRHPKPPKLKGRPEKYKDEYADQAQLLCMLGFTDEKLAKFFNTSDVTIRAWKKRHPEFLAALLKGREQASMKVAASLFQLATGYSHPDEKIFVIDGEITRVKTKKFYPPNYKAIALWLKNKFPEEWREKTEIESSTMLRVGKISEEDVRMVEGMFEKLIVIEDEVCN